MKAVLLAMIGLMACGDNDHPSDTPATCLPNCPAVRTYDAVSYDLHAAFDWDTQRLTAVEDVTLDLAMSGPIVELDAAVAVDKVYAGDQPLAFVVDETNQKLDVDLTPLSGATAAFSIAYTAAPSTSLLPTRSRDDDPVTSRVVFTDSEPDRGLHWLVSKLDPSDRALWSVDLAVDPDEDVIANGKRMSDAMVGGKRVVGYALDKPIPAYLMAFAAGQLEHAERTTGRVPLAVWYRRGLAVDPDKTFDAVAVAMTTFEATLQPYPWDSYTVVLLPYGGGMENATITFDNETSGQGPIGFTLVAHELAHHWFGDWVTMHGFDDVWFKEGMATLLESEADHARRDRESKGRLWGLDKTFSPDDAIVDDSLHGIAKYTSGPYDRAGWMISQIRSKIGEPAFWAGLRGFLTAHAFDSATGEQFLRSFGLDEPTVQQLLAMLPQKTPPHVALTVMPIGLGNAVKFVLTDPGKQLIVPLSVTTIDAAGTPETTTFPADQTSVFLTVQQGGYIAPDEQDVMPSFVTDLGIDRPTFNQLRALFVPAPTAAPAVLAAYASRSAAQQERGLALPIALPAQLGGYIATLDSDTARQTAAIIACSTAVGDPTWTTAVATVLETPPRQVFDTRFAGCGPQPSLAAEVGPALATATPASLARLEYLVSFDFGTATLATIAPVVKTAPSLRLRETAMYRLIDQAEGFAYPAIPSGQLAQWGTFFEGLFAPTNSDDRFRTVADVVVALGDVGALPVLAATLHAAALQPTTQVYGVCDAFAIVGQDASSSTWAAFKTAAMPFDTLAPAAAAAIANPTVCNQKPHRLAPTTKPR